MPPTSKTILMHGGRKRKIMMFLRKKIINDVFEENNVNDVFEEKIYL